jgi:hypothetical protein
MSKGLIKNLVIGAAVALVSGAGGHYVGYNNGYTGGHKDGYQLGHIEGYTFAKIESLTDTSSRGRISSEDAKKWVGNYGAWAGSVTWAAQYLNDSMKKAQGYPDGNDSIPHVKANQFLSNWQIPMSDIDALKAKHPHATGINAYLAFLKPLSTSTNSDSLLKNLGIAMTKAHLVITPTKNGSEYQGSDMQYYYDLVRPCPNMCDTTGSQLYPAYKHAFDSLYREFRAQYNHIK